MRVKNSFLILVFMLASCSFLEGSGLYYKTYKHPSLSFSIDYPRSWELQEGGSLGAQVVFLAGSKDDVFRANANVVSTAADQKNLDVLMQLSAQQLKLILNDYEIITQNKTKLGKLEAFELRGKYTAKEGNRLIRTVVALDGNLEYVFTFTCAFESEKKYTKVINHMIESFTVTN